MVSTTQPTITAPDTGYSLVPFTVLSGTIRLGVLAQISTMTYNLGAGDVSAEIDRVVFELTDSTMASDTYTATEVSAQIPATYDGGQDTGEYDLDWNVELPLASFADGWFSVVATVHTTDGQTRVLEAWEAFNNSAGSFTPRTIFVRAAGDDLNDGLTVGTAVATMRRGVGISQGGDTIDLEAGVTYSDTDFSAVDHENSASDHWITFACSGGTATLTGTHGTNTGFGNHKRWAFGAGILCEEYRPAIQGGNVGGHFWINCPEWRGATTSSSTFGGNGLNPSRYERWYLTGGNIHTHNEFNTAPAMGRGFQQRNFTGDSILKVSRIKSCSIRRALIHDAFQAGGTHMDITQIADTATVGDVGQQAYFQSVYAVDTEAAWCQLSNTNQAAHNFVFEDCVLLNDGLGDNSGEGGGVTNNNLTQEVNNFLFLHCTFIDQSQRWDPVGWDHVQYRGCVVGQVHGGGTATQGELDASDTEFRDGVYSGLADFTSLPGANQVLGAAVFEDRADTNTWDTLDLRLTAASPGKGLLSTELWAGRPTGEHDPGAWARTAQGADWTVAPAIEGGAPPPPAGGTGLVTLADKGAIDGVAELDSDGVVLQAQLPLFRNITPEQTYQIRVDGVAALSVDGAGVSLNPVESDPPSPADGLVWITNAGDLKWRGGGTSQSAGGGGGSSDVTMLHKSFDGTTVSNSTAPHTLLSVSIPAGAMDANGYVHARMMGLLANDNTGAPMALRFKVNFGGVEVYNDAMNLASAASAPDRAWVLDIWVYNAGVTNAQRAFGRLMVGPNGFTTTGDAGDLASSQEEADVFAGIVSAADTTGAVTLEVTLEMSVANATARFSSLHRSAIVY
jgi:hypothetical protein